MKKKEIIFSSLLVLPFCLHWLMPDGLERSFYVNIFGIPFFIPNICFIAYLLSHRNFKKKNDQFISLKKISWLKILLLFLTLYTLLISIVNDIDGLILVMFNNQSFIISAIIYILFPLPNRFIKNTKYVIIPTALILAFEVILYSLGIVEYEKELGYLEYGGITRISTTVGAATGTGIAIAMLGAIILSYYDLSLKYKIAFILLFSLSILFTISRGSILLWGLFIIFYTYKTYYSNSSFIVRINFLVVVSIIIAILNWMGAFNPVVERSNDLVDNFDTGRIEKVENVIVLFQNSNGFGIGSGQTKLDKSISNLVTRSTSLGAHNYYLSALAELGVIGLGLIIFFILIIVSDFNFKNTISFFSILLLLITFPTEPVFTF